MFGRLTDRARRVMALAQYEGERLGSQKIGTEHILLGMTIDAEGGAGRALRYFGMHEQVVRQTIAEKIIPTLHDGILRFTPNGKWILEEALRQSLQLGHQQIGTEHILLAMLEREHCAACDVMLRLKVRPSELRAIVLWSLSGIEDSILELAQEGNFEDASKRLLLAIEGAEALSKRLRALHDQLVMQQASRSSVVSGFYGKPRGRQAAGSRSHSEFRIYRYHNSLLQ